MASTKLYTNIYAAENIVQGRLLALLTEFPNRTLILYNVCMFVQFACFAFYG